MTSLDAVVYRLIEEGRPAILERFRPSSCIASTRVAVEVLRAHGFPAWAQATRAMFTSPGWSVAIAGTGDMAEGQYDAHVVAVAREGQRHVLVDLSADQASRPERGLIVEPVAFAFDGTWPIGKRLPSGAIAAYDLVRSRAYRSSPDWAQRSRWAYAVDRLLSSPVDPVTHPE